MRGALRGAVVVPPGALSTVVCSCVGWLSHGGAGVGAAFPVVGVPGFGFRVCRYVWLGVRGAAWGCRDPSMGVAERLGARPVENRNC